MTTAQRKPDDTWWCSVLGQVCRIWIRFKMLNYSAFNRLHFTVHSNPKKSYVLVVSDWRSQSSLQYNLLILDGRGIRMTDSCLIGNECKYSRWYVSVVLTSTLFQYTLNGGKKLRCYQILRLSSLKSTIFPMSASSRHSIREALGVYLCSLCMCVFYRPKVLYWNPTCWWIFFCSRVKPWFIIVRHDHLLRSTIVDS